MPSPRGLLPGHRPTCSTATIQRNPKTPRHTPLQGSTAPVCADVTRERSPNSHPRAQGNAVTQVDYTSDYFTKMRNYAEASGHPWFILSAEHGLVQPDEWLEPYDCYLPTMPGEYRRAWGRRVREQLESSLRAPGLYSWWVDDGGAADLAQGLERDIVPGLIYVGLAGATRKGGGRSSNTLWGRIATMHRGKNHQFSTLRLSLGATLAGYSWAVLAPDTM